MTSESDADRPAWIPAEPYPFPSHYAELDRATVHYVDHAIGDAVLKELGEIATRTLRTIDTVGRWGGEEFLAVLPETDAEAALAAAERIRSVIASHRFGDVGGLHLTCSVGVAAYPHHAEERAPLLEQADKAMYAAKRLGRNQAIAAGDPAVAAVDPSTVESREQQALLNALAMLVDVRDSYTGAHVAQVASLSHTIALALGCDELQAEVIRIAGRLHDVGKVAVPDAILRKPGKLTEEEWRTMRTHPVVGADIVSQVPRLRSVAPIIRAHHERWDGTGYPERIAGETIPLGARIVAVADAYGAMITERPYSTARTPASALAELRRCAGTQFDPRVVRALEHALTSTEQQHQRAA